MRALGIVGITGVVCLGVGCAPAEDDEMGTNVEVARKALVAPSALTDSGKATRRFEGAKGSGVEFSINAKDKGSYRVRVWGSGLATATVTTMYVDGKPAGTLNLKDKGWQYYDVAARNGGKRVNLAAGRHTIAFRNSLGRAPEIEKVEIAIGEFPATTQGNPYAEYIASLKQNILTSDYGAKKSAGSKPGQEIDATPGSKGNYCYAESVQFNYTYRAFYYLSAGQSVSFSTQRSDGNQWGSDPVMYLTSVDDPSSYHWYSDDYVGYQPRITIGSVPYSGTYMLLIRAWDSSNPGTTDFYMNDGLQESNIAVAGKTVYCYLGKTGTLNYFTANLSSGGDSYMMLIDSQTAIAAYNDDFYDSQSDFSWGYNSRIHRSFSNYLDRVVLSTWSSSNPWGMADVYLQNEDSDIMWAFENLKSIDAIMSAPWDGEYNCIAWSGGYDWDWIWPPSQEDGGVWYDPDPQKAFDNWYGNHISDGNYAPRYSTAWYYDRASATESNAVVDVWAYPGGGYTHGSVRAKGNTHSHGYDWESKPGGLTRTFHPRNALHGEAYGEIYQHYFGAGIMGAPEQTLSEAVAAGTDVIENVSLAPAEASKLSALKAALPAEKAQQFDKLYGAWKKTWSDPKIAVFSDPAKYTESKEYSDLYQLCKTEGKALWPLAFEKVLAGDVFARRLVANLTFAENQPTFERIRSEHQKPRYTTDGKFVVTTPSTLMKKYVQELLASM